MQLKAMEIPKRRGRPPKLLAVPAGLLSLQDANPETAAGWFDLADRLLLLEKSGCSQGMLGAAIGRSQATISRLIKTAAWPARLRARILIHEGKFPPPLLMRLARITWKDQGRVGKDGRRRVLKSRMTLEAAVEQIIEGKNPFTVSEPAQVRAARMQELANEERSSRQATVKKLEDAEAEIRALKKELSMDKFSAALRRVKELEAEVQRLAHAPGMEAAPRPKSENLLRTEGDVSAALNGAKANIIDWGRGLMLLSAGNGDVLEGICERIKLLTAVRFKNGRPLCPACRAMIP